MSPSSSRRPSAPRPSDRPSPPRESFRASGQTRQPMSMNTQRSQRPSAIILAAGKGTRMRSDLPKVVHPIGGRPMVCAVVDAVRAAGCGKIVVVVGYEQEKVREALAWTHGHV